LTRVPHARLVLSDAELVRCRLEDELDEREWRLDWALAVVLLRTIGDVLDKVDGAADPRVKQIANELYRSWDIGVENAIWRHFIKQERDSIVHEYRTAMSEGPVAVVNIAAALSKHSMAIEDLLDENLYRPMASGPFAGDDGRDLLDDALEWWRIQLDQVDQAPLA
jgi:hypothetical protein